MSESPNEANRKYEVDKHPRGLCNVGNTCYFNSIIQPLCHTYSLYHELWLACQKGELPHSFYEVCHCMRNGETVPFAPNGIRDQFIRRTPRFKDNRQHDAHECLRHFLHELRKEERATGKGSLTVVDKIFGGHLITVYTCKECDRHYHLFEPCLDILLPVFFEVEKKKKKNEDQPNKEINERQDQQRGHSNSQTEPKTSEERNDDYQTNQEEFKINCENEDKRDERTVNYYETIKKLTKRLSSPMSSTSSGHPFKKLISLSDCLEHFSKEEEIHEEYLCEDCLRKAMANGEADEDNLKLTSATKQTLIFNPPAVLTIHFKRFELLPGRCKKRYDMVKYPEYLDLAPYCSSECLRNNPPRKNIWYSLYAVVVHSGFLEFGHYVSYVKVRNREKSISRLQKFLQPEYFDHNVSSDKLIEMLRNEIPQEKTSMKRTERDKSKWYLVNDSCVREVKRQKVLEQKAYLLFYERIDENADSSEMNDDFNDEDHKYLIGYSFNVRSEELTPLYS